MSSNAAYELDDREAFRQPGSGMLSSNRPQCIDLSIAVPQEVTFLARWNAPQQRVQATIAPAPVRVRMHVRNIDWAEEQHILVAQLKRDRMLEGKLQQARDLWDVGGAKAQARHVQTMAHILNSYFEAETDLRQLSHRMAAQQGMSVACVGMLMAPTSNTLTWWGMNEKTGLQGTDADEARAWVDLARQTLNIDHFVPQKEDIWYDQMLRKTGEDSVARRLLEEVKDEVLAAGA